MYTTLHKTWSTFDELPFNLCPHCAVVTPQGLFAIIKHDDHCPRNTFEYKRMNFRSIQRLLTNLFYGTVDEMKAFYDILESFTYLKAMPNYSTSTELEKRIYLMCRESDLRSLARLIEYVKLEEKFNDSY